MTPHYGSELWLGVAGSARNARLLFRVELKDVHWFVGERTFNPVDQFKADQVGAFRASGKFFTFADCYGVRQAMLGVNNTINSAFGNHVTGVVLDTRHQQGSKKMTANSSRPAGRK